jgi:serine/threonine protein kinase
MVFLDEQIRTFDLPAAGEVTSTAAVTGTAAMPELLGISRRTLVSRLAEFGLLSIPRQQACRDPATNGCAHVLDLEALADAKDGVLARDRRIVDAHRARLAAPDRASPARGSPKVRSWSRATIGPKPPRHEYSVTDERLVLALPARRIPSALTVHVRLPSLAQMTTVAPDLPAIIASRYVPVRLIAKGGMGAVYEVEHARTGEHLALKVLLSSVGSSAEELERFKREARASARIKSEHVVRVTDADVAPELGGAPFLVMELLEGADLEREAASAPLPPATVVGWLRQVARALDKAHRLGIVHRDLKPENLFLAKVEDRAPIVKILDFGIVKMLEDGAGATGSGQILGTPKYMAPEQASTQKAVTAAADRYALGLVAYRLLVGESYYRGDVLRILAQLLHDPLELPSQRQPTLGSAFDVWFLKACHRDPEARFTSASEQIEALSTAFGLPTLALQGADEPIGGNRTGGSRRRVVAAVLVAAGLVGATLAWILLNQRPGSSRSAATVMTSVSSDSPSALPPPSPALPPPTTLRGPRPEATAADAQSTPAMSTRGSERSGRPRRHGLDVPRGAGPVPTAEVPKAPDPYADQK